MRTSSLFAAVVSLAAVVSFAGTGCSCGRTHKEPPTDVGISEVDAEQGPRHTCVAPERPPSLSRIELVQVFQNLEFTMPMGLFQAPGDSTRWYLVEQTGTIKVIEVVANVATATDFLEDPLTIELGTTYE